MFYNIRRKLTDNLKNIYGLKTNRKLVLFESDDWGSNRIFSADHYKILIKKKIINDNNLYDKADRIEGHIDLSALSEVLTSYKDSKGNFAHFTIFFNPCNPDFQKIKEYNFEKYIPESYTNLLDRYGESSKIMALWESGMKEKIFTPEYHAREHLAVPLWMSYLKSMDEKVHIGFENFFYSVPIDRSNKLVKSFRPALCFENISQTSEINIGLLNGLDIMNSIFNYYPKIFCPPNGISHPIFDQYLYSNGIHAIKAKTFRKEPDGKGGFKTGFYPLGFKNKILYYERNCGFEPNHSRMNVDFCLNQIKTAFYWKKPAIISTHRVNYNGSIDPANREKGLYHLKLLLKEIIKNWPDVEFVNSFQMYKAITENE